VDLRRSDDRRIARLSHRDADSFRKRGGFYGSSLEPVSPPRCFANRMGTTASHLDFCLSESSAPSPWDFIASRNGCGPATAELSAIGQHNPAGRRNQPAVALALRISTREPPGITTALVELTYVTMILKRRRLTFGTPQIGASPAGSSLHKIPTCSRNTPLDDSVTIRGKQSHQC